MMTLNLQLFYIKMVINRNSNFIMVLDTYLRVRAVFWLMIKSKRYEQQILKEKKELYIMKKLISLMSILILSACQPKHNQDQLDSFFKGSIAKYNRELTNIIVSDIFTPPVASRIYAYPNIAAYESIRFMDSKRPSLVGQLNDLDSLTQPDKDKPYYYPLASIIAFTGVAKSLVYDSEKIDRIKNQMLEMVQEIGIDKEIYKNSVSFGETIANEILNWASKDGYNIRTALPGYSLSDDLGRWRPTPPNYLDAIEPHWNTIRPFVLDSVNQFDPGPPTAFDIDQESKFFKGAIEVYQTVNNIDAKQLEIAKFWNCNPNTSQINGHVMSFKQQISPGGHWIHITAQVLEEKKLKQVEAAAVMAQVSIAIADAFISSWDQKYKSNLIRPETYINKYIDPDWSPLLQTPAFPEHTSAHSVASTAAASLLTHIFGENYKFIDSTEVPFGLPKRSFISFLQASQEAAISRLYGGIHYRPAIELGMEQGRLVGKHVMENVDIN